MELRHLRYFVAVGEDQHYGRAAQRLRVAQPALSRQIQDLEEEIGFKLFDRLSRGVKISAAGKLFLEDARRILQQVNEATTRAARVAHGKSGTLRIGFTESASWHGVVPDSFRQFRQRVFDSVPNVRGLPRPRASKAKTVQQSVDLPPHFLAAFQNVHNSEKSLQISHDDPRRRF